MKDISKITEESEYLADKLEYDRLEYGYIYEAGLSKVLQHTKNPFAILTAFRKDFSLKQNRQSNSSLESDLKANKSGGVKLIGHWMEGPEGIPFDITADKNLLAEVTEESYFVPKAMDIEYDAFETLILRLVKKYKQDAAVISNGNTVSKLFKTGRKKEIEKKVTTENLAAIFSQIRGRPNYTFLFEGTIQPINVSSRYLFRDLGLKWLSESGGFIVSGDSEQ